MVKTAQSLRVLASILEKRAYFNQGTWLPGRTYRDTPILNYKMNRDKDMPVYACLSCGSKRYLSASNCPQCGGTMKKVS